MDHGSMNMQGGPAPADARDPHAYSNGLTLESGPYALPGPRQLRLSDEHAFGSVLLDRLERVYTKDGNATAYDAQAWFGGTYDRLVLKAEGDVAKGKLEEARTEVLWGHAIASYWDTQLGVRQDSGTGPDRTWLAFGIQGLAPYWFNVDATAYVGSSGRTALRLSGEYELLLTQRLILQPRMEVNLYGRRDEARGLGSGLADASGRAAPALRVLAPVRALRRRRMGGQVWTDGGFCARRRAAHPGNAVCGGRAAVVLAARHAQLTISFTNPIRSNR
ncbi:MAG: hypothetical protein KatS3mg128_0737 [Silanimonas sp.]|nr:MAG: hypothetical protein KatS3mg128_0737 [Silanimonas sp.]